MDQQQFQPGYVKRKIRERKTSKEGPLVTRARVAGPCFTRKGAKTPRSARTTFAGGCQGVGRWTEGYEDHLESIHAQFRGYRPARPQSPR